MRLTAAQVRRLKMQVPSHFLTFIATFAAVLCVVQALPVAYNISSGGCRSRQYAVDEAVKHASGQEYCECVCPANAPWRCDCSGLVSRAWGLGAPGLTTYDFHPNYCEKLGSRGELEPADALLWPGVESQGTGHVVMFVKWVDKVSTDLNNETRALIPRSGCWSFRRSCMPQPIHWVHAWPAASELLRRLFFSLPRTQGHCVPLRNPQPTREVRILPCWRRSFVFS